LPIVEEADCDSILNNYNIYDLRVKYRMKEKHPIKAMYETIPSKSKNVINLMGSILQYGDTPPPRR
jgi:hypothetical protein